LTRIVERLWVPTAILVFIPLYLYARLFSFSGVPYLSPGGGDQTFFWQYALRMLHGERPYRDFFQFTPPGLDLYFLALFRLFGVRLWVVNFAAVMLGIALSATSFALATRFMRRNDAVLTALLYIVFVYGGHLDVTHHWFSLLAALAAAGVLMPARTDARASLAGLLLGVAAFFTQTAGIATAIALLLAIAWERAYGKPWGAILRQQEILLLAFIVSWFALSAPFIANAGWRRVWYFQVIYAQRYVDVHRGFLVPVFRWNWSRPLLQRLFLYLLLLLIYPWVLWNRWCRRHEMQSEKDMPLVLLAMTGLSLLLGVITRTNWTRLYGVSMPAVILLMWAFAGLSYRHRRWLRASMWIVLLFFAAAQIRSPRHHDLKVTDLPAGTAAVSPEEAEEFVWLARHTKPGDNFLQALWPGIYLPLDLRSPLFLESLRPERLPPEYVALSVQQAQESEVKYILWSPWLNISPQASTDNLQPFRDFMIAHYKPVHVFSNGDEIWQRL